MKKDIFKMSRTQIIDELRGHVHPKFFHEKLTLSTAKLRGLLAFHRSSEADKHDGRGVRKVFIGIDWGYDAGITVFLEKRGDHYKVMRVDRD